MSKSRQTEVSQPALIRTLRPGRGRGGRAEQLQDLAWAAADSARPRCWGGGSPAPGGAGPRAHSSLLVSGTQSSGPWGTEQTEPWGLGGTRGVRQPRLPREDGVGGSMVPGRKHSDKGPLHRPKARRVVSLWDPIRGSRVGRGTSG